MFAGERESQKACRESSEKPARAKKASGTESCGGFLIACCTAHVLRQDAAAKWPNPHCSRVASGQGEKEKSIVWMWSCPVTSRLLDSLHESISLVVPFAVKDISATGNNFAIPSLLFAKFSPVLTRPRRKKTVLLYGGTDAQRKVCEKMIVKEKRFISTTVMSCSRDPLEEIMTWLGLPESPLPVVNDDHLKHVDLPFSEIGKLWDFFLSAQPLTLDAFGVVSQDTLDIAFDSLCSENKAGLLKQLCEMQLVFPHDDNQYVIPSLLFERQPPAIPDSYRCISPLCLKVGTSHLPALSELLYTTSLKLYHKYPKSAKFFHNAVRMEIDMFHLLQINQDGERGQLKATILVKTSDPSLRSTKSAQICEDVKHALMLPEFTLGVQEDGANETRFISLPIPHTLIMSDQTAYLWSGMYGPPGNEIENHYADLDRDIVLRPLLSHLRQRGSLSAADYDHITSHRNADYHTGRLLNLFQQRGEAGVVELADALRSSGQSYLAKLIHKSEATSLAIVPAGTQESQAVVEETPRPTFPRDAEQSIGMGSDRPFPSRTQQTPLPALPSSSSLQTSPPAAAPLFPGRSPAGLLPLGASSTRGKGEPTVQPIFEAKYYHVERGTDYFNERPYREGGKRLGSGSFGTVYYALLHSETGEKYEVAVKRLKKASSLNLAQVELTKKQFGNEINVLSKYIHECIVSLVGFSSDGPELCLIYEYMANGSLSHRLDCRDKSRPLPWQTRLSIAYDIACGLDYLHNEFSQSVIHRDIKSSNVLLTLTFRAKISDFGLAVVAGDQETLSPAGGTSVGTKPYMPQEVFQGVITVAFDVYAFGIVLYELATGLPSYSSKKKQDLKSYVDEIDDQGIDLQKMLDPKAKWPKAVRKGDGELASAGLGLLAIAKRATKKEYKIRERIHKILPDLKSLVLANLHPQAD